MNPIAVLIICVFSLAPGDVVDVSWLPRAEYVRWLDEVGIGTGEQAAFVALYDDLGSALGETDGSFRDRLQVIAAARSAFESEDPNQSAASAWIIYGNDFGYATARRAWLQQRADAVQAFESSVSERLSPGHQRTSWDQSTLTARRHRTVADVARRGGIPGVDLVHIIDSLDLPAAQRGNVIDVLSEYEVALDASLTRWHDEIDILDWEFATSSAERRPNRIETAVRRVRDVRRRVSTLALEIYRTNKRYAVAIAEALEEPHHSAFLEVYGTETYPSLYAASPVELAVPRLLELTWLDDGDREALRAIYASYCLERDRIRDRMIASIEAWNAPETRAARSEAREDLLYAGENPAAAFEGHTGMVWLQQRRQHASETSRQLLAVLSSEEIHRLPASIRMLLYWWDD